jgi:hypothetical protein
MLTVLRMPLRPMVQSDVPSAGRSSVQKFLLQAFATGTLAATGLLLGVVPWFDLTGPQWGSIAYAQDVSNQEVQSYAQSVLAMEPYREAAFTKIQQITGSSEVPVVACHRPSSLSNLPENIRDIAIDYCNQAIAIVERNGLTITRFNQITVAHQSDATLRGQIQAEICKIQGSKGEDCKLPPS